MARKLREAGAVLLGKANLSEWANFRSIRSSSGWSGRGGQCRNPYVLDRNPCGSSSGSGAAASASLCGAAIGTETNGSIVCPSNANGVVGIKPTVGLVSRSRIIPISHTQDTAGPMARTVRDAALVLGALTGLDPEDPATTARRRTPAPTTPPSWIPTADGCPHRGGHPVRRGPREGGGPLPGGPGSHAQGRGRPSSTSPRSTPGGGWGVPRASSCATSSRRT